MYYLVFIYTAHLMQIIHVIYFILKFNCRFSPVSEYESLPQFWQAAVDFLFYRT